MDPHVAYLSVLSICTRPALNYVSQRCERVQDHMEGESTRGVSCDTPLVLFLVLHTHIVAHKGILVEYS